MEASVEKPRLQPEILKAAMDVLIDTTAMPESAKERFSRQVKRRMLNGNRLSLWLGRWELAIYLPFTVHYHKVTLKEAVAARRAKSLHISMSRARLGCHEQGGEGV